MANASSIYTMNGKPATLNPTDTNIAAVVLSSDSTLPVQVFMPGGGRLDGKSFRVVADGYITGGTTTNATVTLQFGTSKTPASNTTIEASSARAVNTTTRPFHIEATCVTDSVVKTMAGAGVSWIGNTLDGLAALDNAPTSVDPATEGQGFVVCVTFSTGNAGNKLFLKNFALEVI